MRDELFTAEASDDERVAEVGLRPQSLDDFVGQVELKGHLRVMLQAARGREQAIGHMLFAGPPGLGKTTLATIIANEMGATMHVTSGPALEKGGDLAAILTKLEDGDVLFIDEIHRLPRPVEEVLYPAMEDFQRQNQIEYQAVHSHYWLSGWAGNAFSQTLGIPHIITFHTLSLIKMQILWSICPIWRGSGGTRWWCLKRM